MGQSKPAALHVRAAADRPADGGREIVTCPDCHMPAPRLSKEIIKRGEMWLGGAPLPFPKEVENK